jgi:hypothetical protein
MANAFLGARDLTNLVDLSPHGNVP